MKRILVPHDNSKLSNLAFEKAMKLCTELDSELFLLTVIGPQKSTSGRSSLMARKILDDLDAEAQTYLKKLKKSAEKKGVRININTIRDPSASRGINRFVNKNNIDLIIIASRGRSGLKKVILGSVASNLLKNLDCPIMILKKPKKRKHK